MHHDRPNETLLLFPAACHGDGKNESCVGGTVDECEVDIAVVIVVVLVIFAWLTGYLCLQKVEERKLKIQKKTNTCSNMKLDCVGQY